MKQCPICLQNYDDTEYFCANDGSTLMVENNLNYIPFNNSEEILTQVVSRPFQSQAVVPPKSDSAKWLYLIIGVLAASLFGISIYLLMPNNKDKSGKETSAATKENQNAIEGMVYVSGGEFMMGNENGDEYEKPTQKVTVKPFYIDIYEVTCNDYKKFIEAANYKPPQNWKTRDIPAGWEKRPVTAVNWDDANAYAKWTEKRLPTEAEWEFAARGTDGRIYPWGNDWKEGMANANGASKEMKDVGSFQGKSPFGAFDMVGNAWEWTADDAKWYKDGKSISSATKTLSPKIIRGGYYENPKDKATVTYRRFWGARDEKDYGNSGFRCVKD